MFSSKVFRLGWKGEGRKITLTRKEKIMGPSAKVRGKAWALSAAKTLMRPLFTRSLSIKGRKEPLAKQASWGTLSTEVVTALFLLDVEDYRCLLL
jgi:hypothetical protein